MPKHLRIGLQTASSRRASLHLPVLPHLVLSLLPPGRANLLCALQKQVLCYYYYFHIFFFDPPTDTVPIYDGRKHQLKVPEELRNVPAVLSRYPGEIPYHSLVLVAYTVSLYRAAQGSRKDQPTIPLNISFAVVLQDEPLDYQGSDGGEDGQDDKPEEEDGNEAEDRTAKATEDQFAEVEDESNVEDVVI